MSSFWDFTKDIKHEVLKGSWRESRVEFFFAAPLVIIFVILYAFDVLKFITLDFIFVGAILFTLTEIFIFFKFIYPKLKRVSKRR